MPVEIARLPADAPAEPRDVAQPRARPGLRPPEEQAAEDDEEEAEVRHAGDRSTKCAIVPGGADVAMPRRNEAEEVAHLHRAFAEDRAGVGVDEDAPVAADRAMSTSSIRACQLGGRFSDA